MRVIQSDEDKVIHDEAIVVDTHNDTMCRIVDPVTWLPVINLGDNNNFHITIDKAKIGGLHAAFYAAFTIYEGEGEERFQRTNGRILALLNALYYTERLNKDTFKIVSSVKEIIKAKENMQHCAIPAIEGAYSMEEDNAFELLEQYYDLGVRYITLVWNHENNLGAGSTSDPELGLTSLGKKVIDKMNEMGIMVDVSHMNEKTFWDTIEYSKGPVFASHSSCSRLIPHLRNLTDEQIKAVAKTGGTININFWQELLCNHKDGASIENIGDHIEHVINLTGVEFVGIGSDFDGTDIPKDLKDAKDLPKLTKILFDRGYTKDDLFKILGGNTLNLMARVEKSGEVFRSKRNNLYLIDSDVSMGDIIAKDKNVIIFKVKSDNESLILPENIKVVLDGKVYGEVNKIRENIFSFNIPKDLLKGLHHVITLEVLDEEGYKSRKTIIFYIDDKK